MMLGQVVETDGGQQINEDLVTIIMSPQHIKAFVAGILRTIAAYEKTFGEIPDNLKLVREKVEAKAKKT